MLSSQDLVLAGNSHSAAKPSEAKEERGEECRVNKLWAKLTPAGKVLGWREREWLKHEDSCEVSQSQRHLASLLGKLGISLSEKQVAFMYSPNMAPQPKHRHG